MSRKAKIFTVYEKPDLAAEEDRVVLVEEGFSYLATVFTLFWLLFNRLWLVSLGFIVLCGVLAYVGEAYGLPPAQLLVAELFVSLMLGFTAFDLKRWTLERRGYRLAQVVVAESQLGAEQRYYDHMAA